MGNLATISTVLANVSRAGQAVSFMANSGLEAINKFYGTSLPSSNCCHISEDNGYMYGEE